MHNHKVGKCHTSIKYQSNNVIVSDTPPRAQFFISQVIDNTTEENAFRAKRLHCMSI